MPELVVTVNDGTQLPRLRAAIRQLKGVEHVALKRDTNRQRTVIPHGRLHYELHQRADALGLLSDGWDGIDSRAISPQSIRKFKLAIGRADEKLLKGWTLFPDAHGFLYLDYTGSNAVAGITMTSDRIIYFIKKDGNTVKNDGTVFTSRNLLAVLERVHG